MTPANLSCSFGDITIILAFVPLSNSFKLFKASEEVEDEGVNTYIAFSNK